MTAEKINCPQCARKTTHSISNRCMYCGATLPEEHHLSAEEKTRLLSEKLERFKENEQNAADIVSTMRRDFGLKEPKKSRKQRKDDGSAAVAAALASINNHTDGGNGSNH